MDCSRIRDMLEGCGAAISGTLPLERYLELFPEAALAGMEQLGPESASMVVFGIPHDPGEPELDWWHGEDGGTPGNRILREISGRMVALLQEEFGVWARDLPYQITSGGACLKEAAYLAGLGVIGRNNLLITPEYGPRVRFRAMLVDTALPQTGPSAFAPCEGCDAPCLGGCDREAFASGWYRRPACKEEMEANERAAHRRVAEEDAPFRIKYCRDCELACPVGA